MHRRVKGDLYVVGECVSGEHGHEPMFVYILKNKGRPILIDTGSHLHRMNIMNELDQVLDGAVPDVVFLTHTELPHTGNVRAIMKRWPKIIPVAPNLISAYIELAPVVGLERISYSYVGEPAIFAGRPLEFLHAVLKDQPGTQWIYDPTTKALFTADAFGYFHTAGKCGHLSANRKGIGVDAFAEYHGLHFKFIRWVIPERFERSIDRVFERDIRMIAPTHGTPIIGDVGKHVERLKRAIRLVQQDSENANVPVRVIQK